MLLSLKKWKECLGTQTFKVIKICKNFYLCTEGALQIIGIVSLEPPTLFGAWLNDRCVLGGLPVQDIDHIMAYKVIIICAVFFFVSCTHGMHIKLV